MVYTWAEEGEWIYYIKDAEYVAARKVEKRKTMEGVMNVVKHDVKRVSAGVVEIG